MLGLAISAVIITLYMLWCANTVFAKRRLRSKTMKFWAVVKLCLVSFATVTFLALTVDYFYLAGGEGTVYKKTTINKTNHMDENDPYDNVSSYKKEEGGLDLTIINPIDIKTTFVDVAGQEEAKAEVSEVVDFLKNPDKYTKIGAQLPKGVLLYGPPGTGKTLLARAVAGEGGVTFIAVDGAAFDEQYVGVGAARVRELFKAARKHQPCIIFIDEIDALAPPRSEYGAVASGRVQTINQLLAEMDNVVDNRNTGIIIMAATNRLESIDTALLRPGRFDRKVFIRLPNHAERLAILKLYMAKVTTSDDVDVESLAGTTYQFSGADIKNLVNEAALHAARQSKDKVSNEDFSFAMDKIKLGLKIESASVSKDERMLTAYHEAGHTIVGILSPNYDFRFNKVTVGVRDATLGVTHFELMDDNYSVSKAFLQDNIALLMAGRIAEEMLVGKDYVTTGASNDLMVATTMAQNMVMEWGVSDVSENISYKVLKSPPSDIINNEIQRILKRGYDDAANILRQNRPLLDKLAKALFDKETLDRKEVFEIMNIKK